MDGEQTTTTIDRTRLHSAVDTDAQTSIMENSAPEDGKAQDGGETGPSVALTVNDEPQQHVASANDDRGDDHNDDEGYDLALSDIFLSILNDNIPNNEKNTEISTELAKKYNVAWKEFAEESPAMVLVEFSHDVLSVFKKFSVLSPTGERLRRLLTSALEKYEKEREQKKCLGVCNERQASFASIAFQIKESSLTHDFDLKAFGKKVIATHNAFYEKNDNKLDCVGPYFSFIQSSGMGKTKILYEFKKQCPIRTKNGYWMEAKLVLCRQNTTDNDNRHMKEKEIFDNFLSLNLNDFGKESSTEAVLDNILSYLDSVFIDKEDDRRRILVLMFDEAHYLLGPRITKEGRIDAFLFRAIRLWICSKFGPTHVVAVFAGTNTKIGNFKVESDKVSSDVLKTDTREYNGREFHPRGNATFEPFFQTTTIGCLRKRYNAEKQQNTASAPRSEYELAIPHGRPLFALMHKDNDRLSDGLDTVVRRMLINCNHREWETMVSSWISVLGTRVQMGQTSFRIASEVVGSAYAVLVDVDDSRDETAKITFMPDPVCARLAMCLMDEDWKMKKAGVHGKSKLWWSNRISDIFSQGFCTPEKGDVGEIIVALYLLFCADVLRKGLDGDYKTFSVPVSSWIGLLVGGRVGGGTESVSSVQESSYQSKNKRKGVSMESSDKEKSNQNKGKRKQIHKTSTQMDDRKPGKDSVAYRTRTKNLEQSMQSQDKAPGKGTITFSAVQVCRNYLRAYGKSWEELKDVEFLKQIYDAGIGFYVFSSCEMIDIVFALKMTDLMGKISYIPMVVSVKSHATYTSTSASLECNKMLQRAKEAGGCFFCLLIVLGAEGGQDDRNFTLVDSCVNELINGCSVAAVLRVPTGDQFGLSTAFRSCTVSKQEDSEVFASHYFLGSHHQDGRGLESFAHEVLRSHPASDLMEKTKSLHESLIKQR